MAQINIGKVRPSIKGDWDSVVVYTALDVVLYNNASYIAKATSSAGTTPTSSPAIWQLMSPAGEKGDKGDTGAQGPTGATGATGPQGAEGASAYAVWVADGNTGGTIEDYYAYIKGEKGDTGATGPQGIQGIQGPIGATGPAGADGPQGPQGLVGATGPAGADGSPDTALEVRTKLLTVDGSGSGIDADMLDGAHASDAAGNSTIVKRTSSGYILANYFNTSASASTVSPSNVFVETGSDGFIRKQTPTQFKTNLGLNLVDNTSDLAKPISTATQTALNLKQNTSTAVTTTHVQALHATDALRLSGSTVSLYKGNGTSESITLPAGGLEDTAHSFTANGYQELSNGLIIQWGTSTSTSAVSVNITFPITFPNAVFSASSAGTYTSQAYTASTVTSLSNSGFTSYKNSVSYDIKWMAIGY